jgi:2-polyprenyl-6-methoxyphenol hydroxylase-like FAD-dependent oxidoreductase
MEAGTGLTERGERAVVLGGSMAGLLAARVLSDFYRTVTIVERDMLPHTSAQRPGVPQGRHVHGLLSSGSQVLDELFPGLLADLVAGGANVVEGGLSTACVRFGGRELNRFGRFADPQALVTYLASRPLLEATVRNRVRTLDNVTILEFHNANEPMATQPGRVTGVRVVNRRDGTDTVLPAELVVDASGRGARTPAFLERLGYIRPPEERIVMQVAYASQLLRVPPNTLNERLILVGALPERPTGGAMFACENDTWMVTLAGMAGHDPPTDPIGMLRFAAEFAPAPMMAAMAAAESLSEVRHCRFGESRWRRYDKMQRLPSGLLVVGDAICSFNPVYGQGMSVAALQAIALRDCLRRGKGDLARRFFRAAAQPIRAAWQLTANADLALLQAQGRPSAATRLGLWYTKQVLTAAESDTVVTERLFRVTNLVDRPAQLLHPAMLARVATASRRRRQRSGVSESHYCPRQFAGSP